MFLYESGLGRVMTVEAEAWDGLDERSLLIGAVGVVTQRAAVHHRRVLVDPGPHHVLVALRAGAVGTASGDATILVAESLSPVETTQMVDAPVLGFATAAGTRTSHTAIMAQALGIPAVVGVENLTERIVSGDVVIVDGNEGTIVIRPDPSWPVGGSAICAANRS